MSAGFSRCAGSRLIAWSAIRTLCFSAVFALLLACAHPSASASQDAGASSSPATPPESTKPASSAKGKKVPAPATAKATTAKGKSSEKSAAATHTSSSKGTRSSARKISSRRRTARTRGQQKIDSERALAIQQALIREHYLSGEATGKWNQACEDAMRRYQGDHGWQTKTVPDSRAIIKLGLGPSKDHLLNPESAMTTGPDAPRAASLNPVSHSADPGPPASKTSPAVPAPASTSDRDVPSPQ
jgi:hypothetical protein